MKAWNRSEAEPKRSEDSRTNCFRKTMRQMDRSERDVPAGCRRYQIRPKSYDKNWGIRHDVNSVRNNENGVQTAAGAEDSSGSRL